MPSPFDLIVGVPVDSSGAFVGCERLPAALREAGVADALGGIPDVGNLQATLADPVRDDVTGVIGIRDLVNATGTIRDRIGAILATDEKPFVLGGDCTLLIGVGAALRDHKPEAGLLFVDGHLDCYDGATSQTGEGADMELAVLLGVGAEELVSFGGLQPPLIAHERVAVLGPADEWEAAEDGSPDPRQFAPTTRIAVWDEVAADPGGQTRAALEHLESTSADGFWLHIDLDVISAQHLPAVDYPQDNGLSWEQLEEVLRPAFAHPGLIGANVTILNPTLDTDGRHTRRAVELFRNALA